MLSEWSAECGADDPVVVVPWASPDGLLHWVDLRDDPDALDHITEADEFPALLGALRALNGPRSPVFTSKCDAWSMDEDELIDSRLDLMLEEEVALAGFTSYIDLLPRDRAVLVSRPRVEGLLYRLERALREQTVLPGKGGKHHPASRGGTGWHRGRGLCRYALRQSGGRGRCRGPTTMGRGPAGGGCAAALPRTGCRVGR